MRAFEEVMLDIGPTSSPALSDPVPLFLAEHARSREICAIAAELAKHDPTDLTGIEATAAHLLGYFQGPLVVHEAMEEEIAEILVRYNRMLATTVGVLVTQHAMLHDATAELVAAWTALEAHPAALDSVRVDLGTRTARLIAMTECHHELEEKLFYPRLAELPVEVRRALCAKLHDPRG